jgi:histidinol-phosphate/aromatic aminotransferase/cobyric acid decarboxylase-like protein/choline kinase
MQAIILAAGYGRRMRPLSDSSHKALLPIGSTTILARIVDGLREIDIDDITVVTGYRAEDIERYLREHYPETRFQFVNNERYDTTNNIVSLSLGLQQMKLEGDLVLVECDLLFEPRLLRRLLRADAGNIALVDHYHTGMDGTVVSVSDGLVRQVFPPHVQGPDFQYSNKYKTLNIYRFKRDFCSNTLAPLVEVYANRVDANSYYELVLGMLANVPEQQIAAEVVDGEQWTEVDDPNDLAAARFQFEPDRRAEILDRSFGGQWSLDVLDFSFMRNSYFPTVGMLAAMRHALPALMERYGSTQEVLNQKLGWFLGRDPQRLQTLHGGTQAFPILRDLFSGRTVCVPTPTFGEYRRFDNTLHYEDAPGIDLSELARTAEAADVVVVVNPNNPTGTTLPTSEIYALAERHPSKTFLIDESFSGFSGEPSIELALERQPLENVHVLVSLSKALGVPGLRIGYVYSRNAGFIDEVGRRLPIWNMNSVAEYFLELLLKFRPELAASFEQTARDRENLRETLRILPGIAEVYPSGGDFLLVRLDAPTAAGQTLRRLLLAEEAIEVKDVSNRIPGDSAHLRIAVRKPDENQLLTDALRSLLPVVIAQAAAVPFARGDRGGIAWPDPKALIPAVDALTTNAPTS